jgi:hypothetical protein
VSSKSELWEAKRDLEHWSNQTLGVRPKSVICRRAKSRRKKNHAGHVTPHDSFVPNMTQIEMIF